MKSEEFYTKLKATLESQTDFPAKYLYKFIVPTKGDGIEQVESKFNRMGAVIDTKESSKGKYTAVSILVMMNSADAVIAKYKEMAIVEGILAL